MKKLKELGKWARDNWLELLFVAVLMTFIIIALIKAITDPAFIQDSGNITVG